MADLAALLADLADEQAVLDELVAPLDGDGWATPTPAERWNVRDQIGHLAFFDAAAVVAATHPDRFECEHRGRLAADPDGYMADSIRLARERRPSEVLATWRNGRAQLQAAFETLDPKAKVPWFGPPMSVTSKVTARLMETWAHGQDVADALEVERPATDRLRHVAHIAVRARPFSYAVRGQEMPGGDVFVELTGPHGDTWTWGRADASDRVTGRAEDFCLVLTRRRHVDDTDLVAEGPLAGQWLHIGQAFAGPPGPGRRPGQFRKRH